MPAQVIGSHSHQDYESLTFFDLLEQYLDRPPAFIDHGDSDSLAIQQVGDKPGLPASIHFILYSKLPFSSVNSRSQIIKKVPIAKPTLKPYCAQSDMDFDS